MRVMALKNIDGKVKHRIHDNWSSNIIEICDEYFDKLKNCGAIRELKGNELDMNDDMPEPDKPKKRK